MFIDRYELAFYDDELAKGKDTLKLINAIISRLESVNENTIIAVNSGKVLRLADLIQLRSMLAKLDETHYGVYKSIGGPYEV